jgi:hypothetical protein
MRLDEYFEGLEEDEAARRRKLVEEKSYAIMDHLADVERRFDAATDGKSLFGSTAPSIFVGRSNYPTVSAGVLSPVDDADDAAAHETGPHWFREDFGIDDVFRHRTSLLNSNRETDVRAADRWDDFVGVQREVAIADRPVDVEIGLDGPLDVDLNVSFDDVATPTGPRARAESATLAENPHVPRAVKKTLEDDDWNAQGAINYLYRRGFDVYDINTVLSAGALGRTDQRRLVPTRWSITAVDDTVGEFLRGQVHNAPSVDRTEVYRRDFLGNRFFLVLTPGQWEFELFEMKAPGSSWNPDSESFWLASDHEGYEGRTGYVEETAGAYHAARLGVLEHLADRGRQAKVLVLRHVTEDYWGPAGVWQVRETVRHAFEDEPGVAESLPAALSGLATHLPISLARLRRASKLAAGVQATLGEFGD